MNCRIFRATAREGIIATGDKDRLFSDDRFPIQVKQSDRVGRPDIDAFQAVMEREGEGGRQRGFFVSFGDSRD